MRCHFDIASDHAYDYIDRTSTRQVLTTPGLSRLKTQVQVLKCARWCQKADCALKTDSRKHGRLGAWRLSVAIERLMIDNGEVEVEALRSLVSLAPWVAQ